MYRELFPRIDLVVDGSDGQFRFDFHIAPGGDPSAIKLTFDGAQQLSVDAEGDLRVELPGGELRMPKPFVYQEVNGSKQPVWGQYVRLDVHTVIAVH